MRKRDSQQSDRNRPNVDF